MSASTTDRISEFRRKLRDLMLEYNVEIELDTGYYGDIDGIDFCVDGKRAVEVDPSWGGWNFGEEDKTVCGEGKKTLAQLRAGLKTT